MKVKDKVKSYIASLVKAEVQEAMAEMITILPQLIAFQNSTKEERQFYHDLSKDPFGNRNQYAVLRDRLIASGVPVEDVDIDISDFERWLDNYSEIKRHYQHIGPAFIEKCLEHYLVFRYLSISKDDVVIDMAAAGSPFADILCSKGIKSFRLDLSYPEGVHGINIGADAGNTNLPDMFASAIVACCAYECFMGDADIRFIKEADRILKKKGRYGIVPLYLDNTYFITTSPYCDQKNVVIENGATKVWREDEFRVPFSRHYSPESFKERIYSKMPGNMTGKVLYFRNLPDVMQHYSGQLIYSFFMFYCEK